MKPLACIGLVTPSEEFLRLPSKLARMRLVKGGRDGGRSGRVLGGMVSKIAFNAKILREKERERISYLAVAYSPQVPDPRQLDYLYVL